MLLSTIKNSIFNAVGSVLSQEKSVNIKINKTSVPSSLSITDKTIVSTSSKRFTDNKSLHDVISGKKNLAFGAKGEDVKLIQNALKDMGFYIGDKAEGKYDGPTVNAMKNFQSNRLLPQTGILDKNNSILDDVLPDKEFGLIALKEAELETRMRV